MSELNDMSKNLECHGCTNRRGLWSRVCHLPLIEGCVDSWFALPRESSDARKVLYYTRLAGKTWAVDQEPWSSDCKESIFASKDILPKEERRRKQEGGRRKEEGAKKKSKVE